MKSFVVNARRAAFGWPFYVTWNLAAYTKEQDGPSAKVRVAAWSFLLVTFTTALWTAAWLLALWMAWQVVS